MKLVSVVGARPQFIKLAPVCRALASVAADWRHHILHTGQHYDYGMSEVFFDDLDIPRPDANLNIGSGKQGVQTAAMITALEEQFEKLQPAGVIVYGDTNSTLAATIAASKLHIPQFHVEAGLRSFDRRMPEEINRVITDHCAELLFAPTQQAMVNLQREGLAARAINVGDVMYDAVLYNAEIARRTSRVLAELGVEPGTYALVTIHRASNTEPAALRAVMDILTELAREHLPILFPMHPRTKAILGARAASNGRLQILEPQSYLDMLALSDNAKLVLTDSGGLQKEAAFLGTPCVTVRDTTEWVETVEIGANTITGLSRTKIRDVVGRILENERRDWSAALPAHYGDGKAAGKIANAIVKWHEGQAGQKKSQ